MATASHALAGLDLSKLDYDCSYRALYESNIYHAYVDTGEIAALLNVASMALAWKGRPAHRYTHSLAGYADLDLYPNYGNRNQESIGVTYKPAYGYHRHARLALAVDFSRRNKDLVDDAGQTLTRTLKKWELDLRAVNRITVGNLRLEQGFRFNLDDYDERDTLAIRGTDTTNVHLLSYDYHFTSWEISARYKVGQLLTLRMGFETEGRSYDERRTYTVRYGAFKGRPFEIRKFRENTLAIDIDLALYKGNALGIDIDYVNRKDNFENFYGFSQWQYKGTVYLQPFRRHSSKISFRFKDKNYPNYHTSNTGVMGRVAIDYADFQVEHRYQFSPIIAFTAYLRNYNKVSNDPSFDYHDLQAGTGIILSHQKRGQHAAK